jgi:hypothetical protein
MKHHFGFVPSVQYSTIVKIVIDSSSKSDSVCSASEINAKPLQITKAWTEIHLVCVFKSWLVFAGREQNGSA